MNINLDLTHNLDRIILEGVLASSADALFTINDIPATASTIADADLFETEQSATSKKVTAAILSAYCNTRVGLTGQPIDVTASTTLTNPMPTIINVNMLLADQAITLPVMNATNSISYSQTPIIDCQIGSQPVIIKYASGVVLATIQPDSAIALVLKSKSTSDGLIETRGAVFSINDKTRYAVLKGADINTDYKAPNYTATSITLDGQFQGISNKLGELSPSPTAESNVFYPGNFTLNPWQRGKSFAFTKVNSEVKEGISADRIHHLQGNHDGEVAITRAEDAPTIEQCGYLARFSHKTEVTTSMTMTAGLLLGHTIWLTKPEFSRIAFQDFVLSFQVKSSTIGTYSISIFSAEKVYSYTTEYTITEADVFQYFSIPIPSRVYEYEAPESSGPGLYVNFMHASGSAFYAPTLNVWDTGGGLYYASANQVNLFDTVGNYIEYEGIKIEKGTTATPYVPYSAAEVLIDCQSHYEKSYPLGIDPGTATTDGIISIGVGPATTLNLLMTVQYKVSKYFYDYSYSVYPTVTLYDAAGNIGKITKGINNQNGNVEFAGLNGFNVASNSAQSSSGMQCHFVAQDEF